MRYSDLIGLYSIFAARTNGAEFAYELRTQDDKARVIWGASPGRELAGEPTATQKIAALEQYVREKGPLDKQIGRAHV